MERVLIKTASMKHRGVAFAVESISNIPTAGEKEFARLESVVLSKI
jgi:hypothetical protein